MSDAQRDTNAFFGSIPANNWLGFRLLKTEDGSAEVAMEPRPEFGQEAALVHGGILSSLADTTAAYCLLGSLPAERAMLCAEFKMNFLKPATLDGGTLVARGNALHRGRKVGVVEVDVLQGERRVARGTFTFIQFDRREARR